MNYLGLRILLNRLRVIPYFLRDKTVKKRKKLLVIFGIIYVLAPVDLIPVFPLDDIILWIFIIWNLKDELDIYWKGDKNGDLSKKFRDKNIVDGVEFSVVDDDSREDEMGPETDPGK